MPESNDLWREVRSDEDAEHALADLGPLMHRKEQVEADTLDPTFRAELRARLVTEAAERDHSDVGHGPGIPAWTVRRNRWPAWIGVAAALAAALAILLVLHGRGPGSRPVAIATPGTPALHPPPPVVADLLRAGPPSLGSGGLPLPELSGFDSQASAYRGHLTLSATRLPAEPSFLPAYRLAGPAFDIPRATAIARGVGIDQPVMRRVSSVDHQAWDVAAMGGPGSNQPLQSLAISRHTGELIYHRAPKNSPSGPAATLNRARAASFARRWIASLGWPAQMPILTAAPDTQLLPPSAGVPWLVGLGWKGIGAAAETQATVIVMPNGDVIDARLWPPVRKIGHVRARDIRSASIMVRTGKVPITVQYMGAMHVSGTGSFRAVEVIQGLDTAGWTSYLVPMYRFDGMVSLPGLGSHKWSALVPAMSGHS
jgi:hypothetical protein